MPVSGLVVFLSEDSQLRVDTLAAIGSEPRIQMGLLEANRLAIVMDTVSSEEDRQLWDWLGSLRGVLFVEVAFVGFEQPGESPGRGGCIPTPARCRSVANVEEGLQDGC